MTTVDLELIGRRVRRSDPAERKQLLAALEGLTEALETSPRAQALVGEILTSLAAEADPELRRKLARWAADGRCASRALALVLAFDGIEVAAPVISRSPALAGEDLLRLVAEGGAEHQIAVGRRRALDAAVVEAILEQGEPAALRALAANPAAPLSREHLERLAGMAKRLPSLRGPLMRRADLPPERAQMLLAQPGRPDGWERRLVGKLQAAGRLTPGYALRVLREGELELFQHALAALAAVPLQEVRAALQAEGPAALGEACSSAGMDRGVLPLVLARVRELNGGRPGDAAPKPVRRRTSAAPRKRATKTSAPRRRTASKRART